jgi:hypothetical protein
LPQVLELPQLAQPDYVAQVDVGPAGVEAHLEAQFPTALEQPDEFLPGDR